jgi:hypothetical protein
MHGARSGLLLLGALAACAPACAAILGDFELAALCVPGERSPCGCDGGDQGTQICAKDGEAFEACQCGSGGGSGSGSGSGGGSGGGEPGTCGDGQTDPAECGSLATYCPAECCGDGIQDLDECSPKSPNVCPADCCSDALCRDVFSGTPSIEVCPGAAAGKALTMLLSCVCAPAVCGASCGDNLCQFDQATAACNMCISDQQSTCGSEVANCILN